MTDPLLNRLTKNPALVERVAHFSPCRQYRYQLRITWDEALPLLVVVGLNPSTADEYKDDPTLRRVQGFARDMGRGGVLMLNAFAWRSTDPRGLLTTPDPVGPENTINNMAEWIQSAGPHRAVAAWGSNIQARRQLRFRLDQLNALWFDCFRRTKNGDPEHPLYLPAWLRPTPWNYDVQSPDVLAARREQLKAAAAIIEGRDIRGATLGLFDQFAEEFLLTSDESPRPE